MKSKSKSPAPAPSRTPRGALALVAVAVVLAAVAWQYRSHDATSPAKGSASGAALAIPGAPHTELTLSASPPDAKLFIDDLPLEGNPYKGTFNKDGHAHRVRAEARGHIDRTDVVVFDKDEVTASLTLPQRQQIGGFDSDGRPIPLRDGGPGATDH